MAELTPLQLTQFKQIFHHFATTNNPKGILLLQFKELSNLFLNAFNQKLSSEEGYALIREWDVYDLNGLTYREFVSMLAYSLKREQLDHDINLSFYFSTNINPDHITPADVQSALQLAYTDLEPVSLDICKEMIWVCSDTDSYSINFVEYIKMITTIYEPGWIVLYNWHKNKVLRFLHDLCDEDQENIAEIEEHELDMKEIELIRKRAQHGHILYGSDDDLSMIHSDHQQANSVSLSKDEKYNTSPLSIASDDENLKNNLSSNSTPVIINT